MRGLATTLGVTAVLLLAGVQVAEARPPHVVLDQAQRDVSDSEGTCAPPGTLAGCTRVEFNFNQSWDPDPRDTNLQFAMTLTTTVTQGCPAWPLANGVVNFAPIAGQRGKFYTYAPTIPAGPITTCDYVATVQATDGQGEFDQDTVYIRVHNDNQAPRFATGINQQLFVNGVLRSRIDLVVNRGGTVQFDAPDITDDKEVVAVKVILDREDEAGRPPHRLEVPLSKITATVDPCCQFEGDVEVSDWRGFLPVDTRDLTTGTYFAWAVAYDREGKNATYPPERVTLQVEENTGADPIPPLLLLNPNQPTSNIPSACFPEFGPSTQRLALALGHGDTLRPVIQASLPAVDPPFRDPNLLLWKVTYQTCVEVSVNAGTCALSPTATTCPVYGPEVPLEVPYHMSLDTLFKGDQEVALRAYDRMGNLAAGVLHLVTDTASPEFMILRDDVNYQGIPFRFQVLVRDRIDTEVSLHIDGFEQGKDFDNLTRSSWPATRANVSMPWVPMDSCPANASTCVVGNLDVMRLPRVSDMQGYDIGGDHDYTDPCQYLFDSDGDGLKDSVLDLVRLQVVGRLLATASEDGDYNDYYLDNDGDGELSQGDTILRGTEQGGIAGAGMCLPPLDDASPLLAFLDGAGPRDTQVFTYNLTRHTLGNASYRVAIRDLVFNQYAAARSTFTYEGGVVNSTLSGNFTTVAAQVDARVAKFTVPDGPFLPGDAVWLNVTVRQDSDQRPEPQAPMALFLDNAHKLDAGLFDCAFDLQVVNRVQTYCDYLVLAPPGTAQPPGEAQAGTCQQGDPVHNATVCLRRPDAEDPRMAVHYAPGRHVVRALVVVDPVATDSDPDNNVAEVEFTVYLGRVVDGTPDSRGRARAGDNEYHILADCPSPTLPCRGTPEMDDAGAVNLRTGERFMLTMEQGPSGPLYRFTDRDGKSLVWDPQARFAVDKALCGLPADSTLPCERPVTVHEDGAPPPGEKASAGFGAVLALLGVALLLRRRD